MGLKLPNYTVLPGGRKVRDYPALTPEQAQDWVGEEAEEEPEEKPKKSTAKKAEDESLG